MLGIHLDLDCDRGSANAHQFAKERQDVAHPNWLLENEFIHRHGGHPTIFDRSWYGRVLVERLEGYCTETDWRRAYSEINQFERQLTDYGTIVFKFWMHISKQEQLRRFRERTKTNYKTWKITDEDWRNRGKWEDYITAAEEMLLKTSTPDSPAGWVWWPGAGRHQGGS